MKSIMRTLIICLWILLIGIVFYFPGWKSEILPQDKQQLNVFAWGDVIDLDILLQFEKETGIKINLSFYNSNEELLVKMKATGGEGYDLIMPSDYAVALLIKDELIKPIDQTQLTFWDQLYPVLLDHPFDPGNRYSVPFDWEVFGFGVDTRFFQGRPPPDSWRAIFDPAVIDYKIAMRNDPIEAFLFGANYLYGPLDSVTEEQFQRIGALLIDQSNWVVAYSDFRTDYYIATGNTPLAVSTTSNINRIHNLFPHIHFIIPKEGSFVTIENFCIPKASHKEKSVYMLLNYLYTPESVTTHRNTFLYLPVMKTVTDEWNLSPEEQELYNYSRADFENLRFIKNIAPQQQVRDLWVKVKSF